MARRPEPQDFSFLPAELAHLSVRRLGAGWENVAYALGDGLLVRVSLVADPAERRMAARRDRTILDAIRGRLSVATPQVDWVDESLGVTVGPIVGGRLASAAPHLDHPVFARSVGEFLAQLHAIAVGPQVDFPRAPSAVDELASAADSVVSQLDRLDPADRRMIEDFLAGPVPGGSVVTVVHNDLGEDHLFVDLETSQLTGVIDWSDAGLGDPARDFALLLFDFGETVFHAALASYGSADDGVAERARWFAIRAGVAGVGHRLVVGERPEDPGLAETLARLRRLLPSEQ